MYPVKMLKRFAPRMRRAEAKRNREAKRQAANQEPPTAEQVADARQRLWVLMTMHARPML